MTNLTQVREQLEDTRAEVERLQKSIGIVWAQVLSLLAQVRQLEREQKEGEDG